MNERISEVLSMLLNAWIYGYPQSSDGESWLCHPSREGFDLVFEWMLGSVILQPILLGELMPKSMVHICCLVKTDFSNCVMANLSSGMRLLLRKDDINK